jgi:hypothetical protein
LVSSALPELPAGDEDDEVGYRLDTWSDRDRGRLIEQLNVDGILHRFEEDELVVAADDEARVDDLVEDLATRPEHDGDQGLDEDHDGYEDGWTGTAGDGPLGAGDDDSMIAGVRLLADAAERLRRDPTDMHADADVAEASASVFLADGFSGADDETWAAVGRVTRRLLSALGADEALEDEIRSQAAILEKLLAPLLGQPTAGGTDGADGDDGAGGTDGAEQDETEYELPEWLPEQRAHLGVLLDDAGISYQWDGDDLVVPADREAEVERLFDRVGAPSDDEDDDDGETRYRALEELFAAADRLAGDPADEQRAADAVERIEEAAGPVPIGLDEIQWFHIMTLARALSEAIRSGGDEHAIGEQAGALRDLLRAVV